MRRDEQINEAQFRGYWRKRFSVRLQKSNSVIMKKMKAISEAGNEDWDDTELDIQNSIH